MADTCKLFSLLPHLPTYTPPPNSTKFTDSNPTLAYCVTKTFTSNHKSRKMGKRLALFFLSLLFWNVLARGYQDEGGRGEFEEGEEMGGGGGDRSWGEGWFLLRDSVQVVRTDAGVMRVVMGSGKGFGPSPMHIGFITMEPSSLFIPQYLDSSLILFVRRGDARVGHIHKDALAERRLRTGDIYRIAAGSAFYIVNEANDRRLQIICSIDTSESLTLGWHGFLSFFIGGGTYPTSVLAGFDPETLSVAFNVSIGELSEIMTTQRSGPIVYLTNAMETHAPSLWSKFLDMEEHQRLAHLKRVVHVEQERVEDEEEEDLPNWSLRKLMMSVFGNKENAGRRGDRGKGTTDSYNIYDRDPDFRNDYGWSKAVDESDYSPLRHSGIGVYLVNLTAGSMMAPHVNPRAMEFGVVLRGTGRIEIVFPNGTLAMNARVAEGDVFWVPRYFPFCQIAARTGPFEFFGYTTASRRNRPQFLVGANSLLHTLEGPEIAAAFGVEEDRFRRIIDAQKEGIILPSPTVAPPEAPSREGERKINKLVKSLGEDMMMF